MEHLITPLTDYSGLPFKQTLTIEFLVCIKKLLFRKFISYSKFKEPVTGFLLFF